MITQLVRDTYPHGSATLLRAGLPVRYVGGIGGIYVRVETPEGETVMVLAHTVSIPEPENAVGVLAEALDLSYNALVKACREDRVLARKSGGVWLTTQRAVEYALEHGRIRRKAQP